MNKPGFDGVAPFYDFLAGLIFGRALRLAQTAFLSIIPPQARLLIIGGGTGWILTEIFARSAPGRIVYLEASAKMLDLARRRITDPALASLVEFRLGTEKDLSDGEEFDIIISHFLLDLFLPAQLENIISTLHRHLRPTGLWLVADFVPVAGTGIWPAGARLLTQIMYVFFRMTAGISARSLPDWESKLLRQSLKLRQSGYFYGRLIKAGVYQKTEAV